MDRSVAITIGYNPILLFNIIIIFKTKNCIVDEETADELNRKRIVITTKHAVRHCWKEILISN